MKIDKRFKKVIWHIKNYSRISESTNVCCIELNTFPSYHVTPYLVKIGKLLLTNDNGNDLMTLISIYH